MRRRKSNPHPAHKFNIDKSKAQPVRGRPGALTARSAILAETGGDLPEISPTVGDRGAPIPPRHIARWLDDLRARLDRRLECRIRIGDVDVKKSRHGGPQSS